MGLDMYIFRKDKEDHELAYWRKHTNLHGYIVNTFANGVDECQVIPLSKNDLENIIQAVEEDNLPHIRQMFFGQSLPEDKYDELQQLKKVLSLMNQDPKLEIYYQASW
jgi:hypothetical protein